MIEFKQSSWTDEHDMPPEIGATVSWSRHSVSVALFWNHWKGVFSIIWGDWK